MNYKYVTNEQHMQLRREVRHDANLARYDLGLISMGSYFCMKLDIMNAAIPFKNSGIIGLDRIIA